MKTTLLAKSSETEPHKVYFILDENNFKVFCNCIAGTFQQLCKHKTAFLNNDAEMLFDPMQQNDLNDIHRWLKQTSWNAKYAKTTKDISEMEKEIDRLQAKRKKLRKDFAVMLSKGVNIAKTSPMAQKFLAEHPETK